MTRPKIVAEVGERELIRRLTPWVKVGGHSGQDFGIGDDCATLQPHDRARTILTKDLLIEGVHFLRNANTDWRLVGHKAAAANISDLAACGADPRALLIGLGLPADFPLEDLDNFYSGLHGATSAARAEIFGGDTTRSDKIVISITAIGMKPDTRARCGRSDAKPGDFLYVTGPLGGSRAGLELLLKRGSYEAGVVNDLIRRHFAPPLRTPAAVALAEALDRLAMIDISDSLYNEAGLLAEASGVQVEIDLDRVPIYPGVTKFCQSAGHDPAPYALFSGEEYELLFSTPLDEAAVHEIFRSAGVECGVTKVGAVKPGTGIVVLRGGNPVDPSDETFVHF